MGDYYQREVPSSSRLLQFKESNCGYRCGWGCEPRGEDSGSGDEGDATPTLVPSDYEVEAVAMEALLPHEDDQMSLPEVVESVERETNPIVFNDMDPVTAGEIPLAHSPSTEDYDESPSSLETEASNGANNSASSDARMLSSADWNGMGRWTGEDEIDLFTLNYYFSSRPLRLSPQHEHCRGHLASHLVVQDDMVLLD